MNKPDFIGTKSKSITEYAYDQIRADIMQGHFKPDQKLRLDELCERYQIGITPLREALSRLCGSSLLINKSQRGFWVAPLSVAELKDIAAMVAMLEAEAFQRSLKNGDDAWEQELHESFVQLRELEENSGQDDFDWDVWYSLNERFHDALIAANDSPCLADMLDSLYQKMDRYFMIANVKTMPGSANHEEHQEMYQAALKRNVLKLCRLSELHTSHLIDDVSTKLDRE